MLHRRIQCYCAFCKNPRKVYRGKHLNFASLVGLILLSYICTYCLWQNPDPRGLFIVACFVCIGEIVVQMRWWQSMICKNCGFDPIIYLKDPALAGEKIKDFLQKRSVSADYLLKPPVRISARPASTSHELSLRA
jgi:hypothetical protein